MIEATSVGLSASSRRSSSAPAAAGGSLSTQPARSSSMAITRTPSGSFADRSGAPEIASLASQLAAILARSEEHTSELQSPYDLVCRLLLEKKKRKNR